MLHYLNCHLDADNLQWIMDSYVLVFGGTLLLMGALGDRFGRKGTLHIGLAIIGLFSAWTAFFAETSNQVIFARHGIRSFSNAFNAFSSAGIRKWRLEWAAMAGIGPHVMDGCGKL